MLELSFLMAAVMVGLEVVTRLVAYTDEDYTELADYLSYQDVSQDK